MRQALSQERLIEVGTQLLNQKGLEAFALKDVAQEVGVRVPSLYNYIDSREHLLMLMAGGTARRFYQQLADAAASGDAYERVRQVALAYLRFAWDHPGEYALMQAPLFWCQSEAATVFNAMFELMRQLTGRWQVAPEVATHFYRSLRSFLHGYADIQRQAGFQRPEPVEDSVSFGLELLLEGWRNYLQQSTSKDR